MVTLNDMLNIISGDKLIEIKTETETIFKGYKGNAERESAVIAAGDREVEKFSLVPEISRRGQSEKLLPVTPANAEHYLFADLNVYHRYTYKLKSE